MVDQEMEIIQLCIEIGGVADCNGHFTVGLPALIKKTGKTMHDLTVSEFLEIIRKRSEDLNNIQKFNQRFRKE